MFGRRTTAERGGRSERRRIGAIARLATQAAAALLAGAEGMSRRVASSWRSRAGGSRPDEAGVAAARVNTPRRAVATSGTAGRGRRVAAAGLLDPTSRSEPREAEAVCPALEGWITAARRAIGGGEVGLR